MGACERASARMEVSLADHGPVLRRMVTGQLAELMPEPPREYPLVPISRNLFVIWEPTLGTCQ